MEKGNGEKNILEKKSYLDVTYSFKTHPKGNYPNKLGRYLTKNYYGKTGKILDIGCGRGDYLEVFKELGFNVSGIDISPSIEDMPETFDVKYADLEKDSLPYPPETFDFVFSKSVVEHMRNPFFLFEKSLVSLKKGGIAVIMTPSWEHTYWGPFYIDHTHVTPFTRTSLVEAMTMAGYKNVRVEYFYQLPILWKYPVLKPIVKFLSAMPLSYRPLNQDSKWPGGINKLIWFSKEVMLLGSGQKE